MTGPRLGLAFNPARSAIVAQWEEPHGSAPLGLSTSTKHRGAGCAVAGATNLVRLIGGRPGEMPLEVQRRAIEAGRVWAKGSASAVIPELVRSTGLRVGGDFIGAGRIALVTVTRPEIVACLKAGGGVLACVDHDRARPKGDPLGDHWVTIYAADDDSVFFVDPNTKDWHALDMRTLTGDVPWTVRGKEVMKPYSLTRAVTAYPQ